MNDLNVKHIYIFFGGGLQPGCATVQTDIFRFELSNCSVKIRAGFIGVIPGLRDFLTALKSSQSFGRKVVSPLSSTTGIRRRVFEILANISGNTSAAYA